MYPKTDDPIARNRVFGWIALATGLMLMIPLIAMQFNDDVRWNMIDFVLMGILLFGMGSLFVLASRRLPRKRRVVLAASLAAVLFYIWAELGVGIFANLGS